MPKSTFSKHISKKEFINRVHRRFTDHYPLSTHAFLALLAVVISFYITFWLPVTSTYSVTNYLPVFPYSGHVGRAGLIITINLAVLYCAHFLARSMFVWTTFGRLSFHITFEYRYALTDFLWWAYIISSTLAILISVAEFEFAQGTVVGPLDLLDAYYFVIGALSTLGSSIDPASKASKVVFISLSAFVLLLVIFIFESISDRTTRRIVRVNDDKVGIGNFYSELVRHLRRAKLNDKERRRVLDYFADRFDYTLQDYWYFVRLLMSQDNFAFAQGSTKRRIKILSVLKNLILRKLTRPNRALSK